MNCEYCGAAILDGAAECPACGAKMSIRTESTAAGENVPAGIVCKQCGKLNAAENQSCENCGNPLHGGYLCSRCEKRFDEAINFCNACGGKIVPLNQYYSEYSRATFRLLTWFFGWIGVNYFYIRRWIVGAIITILPWILAVMAFSFYKLFIYSNADSYYFQVILLWSFPTVWFFNILFAYCIKVKDAQGKRLH